MPLLSLIGTLATERRFLMKQLPLFYFDILADTGKKRDGYRFRSYRVHGWNGVFLGVSYVRIGVKHATR